MRVIRQETRSIECFGSEVSCLELEVNSLDAELLSIRVGTHGLRLSILDAIPDYSEPEILRTRLWFVRQSSELTPVPEECGEFATSFVSCNQSTYFVFYQRGQSAATAPQSQSSAASEQLQSLTETVAQFAALPSDQSVGGAIPLPVPPEPSRTQRNVASAAPSLQCRRRRS